MTTEAAELERIRTAIADAAGSSEALRTAFADAAARLGAECASALWWTAFAAQDATET